MSLNERERIDPGSPQPSSIPAPKQNGAGFDWPHPHRAIHAEVELDPTARLEWLDDLMFAAIDGDPVALDYAADAWHKTRNELGDCALEESRLQYMRHAQTVWHSLRGQPNHAPHKVFAAIEIISLLAGRTR
jgi:hypothetical protein